MSKLYEAVIHRAYSNVTVSPETRAILTETLPFPGTISSY
jgi:hypothetical protein